MVETAERCGADCIVTRSTKDYREAAIPIYTPAEFVALFAGEREV